MVTLIKQVGSLMEQAIEYDIEGLNGIRNELDKLAKPFQEELKELEQNEAVKRYIEAKNKANYIYMNKMHLISYYHK